MSKITTEDCKSFLLDLYKDKKVVNWKRIRKFKDENGDVCREFKHSDGISVTLIEKNGQLSVLIPQDYQVLLSSKPISKTTVNTEKPKNVSILSFADESDKEHLKKTVFTLFDDAQQKAAKRLVNAFVKPKEDPVEPDSSAKGFQAIPNLIYFSFLEDANPDESEYLEEIAAGMNFKAPMRDIAVFFMPSTVKSFSDHISPLIEAFLTLPLYEVEEMSFKINDCDTPLSVTDVFEELCKAGFVYNPDGCALKNLFTQYHMVPTEPVIDLNDKTAEYKKGFLSALKKDDVTKMKALIDSGMPLNFKVGGQSLLGKTMHENKLECFKYLLTLYSNTANTGNGAVEQVWEHVWWPSDCSRYFMANAFYDFTDSNKNAHRHLVTTLVHHTAYFEKMKEIVNPELFSVACLETTLTYDRAYPVFKDSVKKAIVEYPATVSSSKEMVEQLEHGFIIPPILELLASSSCTFDNKTVFEVVQAKIDEIGHDPKGYRDKIEIYKAFLKKYGR
jgi:hypothetical protein